MCILLTKNLYFLLNLVFFLLKIVFLLLTAPKKYLTAKKILLTAKSNIINKINCQKCIKLIARVDLLTAKEFEAYFNRAQSSL